MILYQLQCDNRHEFEAWFRDSNAFQTQSKRKLLSCPACGSTKVSKALMAPRIGRKTNSEAGYANETAEMAESRIRVTQEMTELKDKLAEIQREVEANCDYVGREFAEEARKIHYGETDVRGIYGETTSDESEALKDEGIEFTSIPWLPKENA
ncbi:MAG: hypothetical protein CMM47_11075 [Rhodospirillaceae bacterium]|nr:hypothetical protein [Rhodospirillaceae bacterium]